MVETRKCEIDSALATETARRERAEGRRQELERSTVLLSEELEVMAPYTVFLWGRRWRVGHTTAPHFSVLNGLDILGAF